jgi:hypothetical protein
MDIAPGKRRAQQRKAAREVARNKARCGPVECYRILPDGSREQLPAPPPPKKKRSKQQAT